ncbi:dual-action HEIGH metallo-peptidase [Chitinophaga dinghuensis]|uniref:Dual-action HEIGH metallo-peptidase n=1 Tax=Chitinophaga dinghuensis TaxID=1539050 RepID=A0A327VR97_9BACT|nr:M57 family metalloprotease [Chitinophaga dinghuensis]RAJ76570.1 dual-action HEIGH metallo-peptidase [Chitinophaga dinghuensis]
MKKNLFLMLAVLLTIAIASCKKSVDNPSAQKEETTDPAKKVYHYIIGLGFPAHTIVEHANEFIVEEDIIFPKNMQVPGAVGTEQYYTGSVVSASKVTNIRLYIDASMTSMTSEINSAISQWNSIPGCTINWTVVSSGTYDVLIQDYNLGSGVCGQGTFPSGGAAGGLIRINKAYIAGNSFAQRARTICHEMGHNVSFRHTNWKAIGESTATDVPGVGGTDASSIMNGGQCGSGATVLSTNDKNAAVALYH